MCNRVRADFEFREIKLRWDLVNDLPQFKPIYNASPGRKEADIPTILRTDSGNDFMRPIHDRIPAILRSEDEENWLDCAANPFDKVAPLLVAYPSDQMAAPLRRSACGRGCSRPTRIRAT